MTKQRRWLPWFGAAWAVLLLGLATYAAMDGGATIKEQRSITQAEPVVNRAIQAVITAAGSGPAVVLGGYELRENCAINVLRPGKDYQRAVQLYVHPGTERVVLHTLAAGLPKNYAPIVHTTNSAANSATNSAGRALAGSTLVADAGEFVSLTGTVVGTGWIRVTAHTGCRPVGTGPISSPATPNTGPVTAVFAALGVQPHSWRAYRLGCVQTTTGKGPSAGITALPGRFADKDPIVAADNLVVFREESATVAVSVDADGVRVARTEQICAGQ